MINREFPVKKQTRNLLTRQEKHNNRKVAACFSHNVAMWSKKQKPLDVACLLDIEKDSGTSVLVKHLRIS